MSVKKKSRPELRAESVSEGFDMAMERLESFVCEWAKDGATSVSFADMCSFMNKMYFEADGLADKAEAMRENRVVKSI